MMIVIVGADSSGRQGALAKPFGKLRTGVISMANWNNHGLNDEALVKSRNYPEIVIPVKTGIQRFKHVTKILDTGFHRCDNF